MGYTWSLSADPNNSSGVTGTLWITALDGCPAASYSVKGSFTQTTGTDPLYPGVLSFSVHATNPSQQDTQYCSYTSYLDYNGSLNNGDCANGSGAWNSDFGSGNFNWSKGCDQLIGAGETSTSTGLWGSGTQATVGAFTATISGVNASGREVDESLQSGSVYDDCHFDGSEVAEAGSTLTSGWFVSVMGANVYGYDGIGWNTTGVNYYRQQGRVPCGYTLTQKMTAYCPYLTVHSPYATNTLGDTITLTTVTVQRGGASQYEYWP